MIFDEVLREYSMDLANHVDQMIQESNKAEKAGESSMASIFVEEAEYWTSFVCE